VPDAVDAAMRPNKHALPNPGLDLLVAYTGTQELRSGNQPVLSSGNPLENLLNRGT
jgi:hypothetical protein